MDEQTTKRDRPEWAKAAIVAEYQVDVSDPQTDYFATSTKRSVFLGWSRTDRVSFAELRKVAATFKHTEHLGPGRDRWSVRVVVLSSSPVGATCTYGNRMNWCGEWSPWHDGEEYGKDRTFETEAEARAFMDAAPQIDRIFVRADGMSYGRDRDGYQPRDEERPVECAWKLERESYEHRERYSMGRGLVLGAGHYETGWTVEKRPIGGYCWGEVLALPGPILGELVTPSTAAIAPAEDRDAGGATVRPSSVRAGFVEVVHPARPEQPIIDELKAAGFRWALRSRCWYGPAEQLPARYASPAAEAVAS